MPVGGPCLVPIFGGPARNFRCIIYGRFNEPRKRSKGPRGLFLIIQRRQRRLDRLPACSSLLLPFLLLLLLLLLLLFLFLLFFSSSSHFFFSLVLDTPFSVSFDNTLLPDASRVILITRNIIKTRCEREIEGWNAEDEV